MQPFIVIRQYEQDDDLKCQELLREYIMSFAWRSFYCLCLREITLQFIIITSAILFIFFGVPLTFCSLTIPGCVLCIFCGNYLSFYAKAIELINTKPNQCLVAESYEPFIFRLKPSEVNYQIFINTPPYESSFIRQFRKKIVATVCVKNHNTIHNGACIYRFAIDPEYPFQNVAEVLFSFLFRNCISLGYQTLECTVSQWQEDERNFYENAGFSTRQVYHKQIIGNSITVIKAQLTYNLQEVQMPCFS